MEKMNELYQKVAGDPGLQKRFLEIIDSAEKSGTAETEKNLIAFAQEAGFKISAGEMQDFFKQIVAGENDQLSDRELDMVAGGKGDVDWGKITAGVIVASSVVAGASGAGAPVSVGCVVGAGAVEGATR